MKFSHLIARATFFLICHNLKSITTITQALYRAELKQPEFHSIINIPTVAFVESLYPKRQINLSGTVSEYHIVRMSVTVTIQTTYHI
jgi:hypothetical protein